MTNEQKRSIAISIRISPEELEMLEKLTEAKHQTKTAVIVSALRLYAQSLTAANTSPAEISPAQSNDKQPAGAETAPATETSTTTETPEEISPQAPHSYTADDIRKAAAQAYRAGVQQARQEIRAAATKASRARHTASRAKIQAKRRPRVFKG